MLLVVERSMREKCSCRSASTASPRLARKVVTYSLKLQLRFHWADKATADLTDYDLSSMTPMHFEFQPKDRSITMRLSESLFEAIREEADRSGMPYQRFIRKALEEAVHQPST